MTGKKLKDVDQARLQSIADRLDEFMTALGSSVLMLEQTQKALKRDTVALGVNADQFCASIRRLQRLERALRAELPKTETE